MSFETSMFTQSKDASFSGIGEGAIITLTKKLASSVTLPSPKGIGDDCAVIDISSNPRIISTDSLILDIHFNRQTAPEAVGAKLLKRNISDIAAMGGKPREALLSIVAGPSLAIDWYQKFMRGLVDVAETFDTALIGGDVSSAPNETFVASLTIIGECASPICRHGASFGDIIYTTGELGGSLLGGHLNFNPRINEGLWLAKRSEVSSMIDLSDGIAKDLIALIPQKCAAEIDLNSLPLSDDCKRMAEQSRIPAETHALTDGEDYELLFTIKGNSDFSAFENAWADAISTRLSRIGSLVKHDGPPCIIDKTSGQAWSGGDAFSHYNK